MVAIILALGASVCWGVGDLLAGIMARHGPARSVTLASQFAGLVGAVAVALVLGRPWPGWGALLPAFLAGVALAAGTVTYLRALAVGKMSLVAPIVATCAVVPVGVGVLRGERPGLVQLLGALAAIVGIVLASRESEHPGVLVAPPEALPADEAGDPSVRAPEGAAILLSLFTAICFGLVLVGFAETAKHDPYLTPLAARSSSVTLLGAFFLAGRARLRLSRRALAGATVAGVLHAAAATLFSVATTRGFLSLVAVLSSLSAVVLVALAHLFLRERLVLHQQIGVLAALAGVVAIMAG